MLITFKALFPLFVVVMPREPRPPVLLVGLWVRKVTISTQNNTTRKKQAQRKNISVKCSGKDATAWQSPSNTQGTKWVKDLWLPCKWCQVCSASGTWTITAPVTMNKYLGGMHFPLQHRSLTPSLRCIQTAMWQVTRRMTFSWLAAIHNDFLENKAQESLLLSAASQSSNSRGCGWTKTKPSASLLYIQPQLKYITGGTQGRLSSTVWAIQSRQSHLSRFGWCETIIP